MPTLVDNVLDNVLDGDTLAALLTGLTGSVRRHPTPAAAVAAVSALTPLIVVRAAALAVHRWRHRRLVEHAHQVTILAPPEVDAAGAAVFWATLADLLAPARRRRLLYGTAHVALEYRWSGRALTLTCWVPGTVPASSVAAAARAAWPGAATRIEDPVPPVPLPHDRQPVAGGALTLALPAGTPLLASHDPDPLRPLIHAMTGLSSAEHAAAQILARPASPRQTARLRARAAHLRTGHASSAVSSGVGHVLGGLLESTVRAALDLITPSPTRPRTTASTARQVTDPLRDRDARTAADAAAGPLWETAVRYAVVHTNPRGVDPEHLRVRLRTHAGAIAAAFGVHTARNRLRRLPLPAPAHALAVRALRSGFVLPADQLAALAGLPADVAVPGLDRAGAKPAPAPVAVPTGGRATKPLGRAEIGGHAVALPVADARQHLHVLGATGSGKSTFLTHLILGEVAARRGVVVIDPKGDLATDVLDRLPASVADRLVVIDPDQPDGATFNPLHGADHDLVVDNIVAIFANIFARHWGPRIDDVLRVSCLTLMRHPGTSLVGVSPLLTDAQFRAPFIADLDDPEGLRGFWDWYNTSPPAVRSQAIGAVLARLRAFLLRDFVRTTLDTPASSFDMSKVLDGGILIARLPKGQLGEDTARLMGSFVLASVWQAATARSRVPQDERRDATVVIDEAHNVLNLAGSVSDMLAEARGYRLSLVLAHQDLAQFPREIVLALSANARNKLYFACSPEDARQLVRHTLPALDEHDLSHLDAYTAAARLVIDARTTPAFTLRTRPPTRPLGLAADLRDAIRRPPAATPARPGTSTAPEGSASRGASGGTRGASSGRTRGGTPRDAPRHAPPDSPNRPAQAPKARPARGPERPSRVPPPGAR